MSAVHAGYRRDVAGLRAIAILPILLFHAGIEEMGGGFVGVDIFFVISGFVITRSMVKSLETGSFSILEFYRRRVARILPALILVLAATLCVGGLLLLPTELHELATSAAYAASFISNFFFLEHADYFAGAAESKPLLHTWSLAVEEQFYIFYPVGLLLIWKAKPEWLKATVIGFALASFVGALVIGQMKTEAAFYMLPTRAWEFGMGVAVALGAVPAVHSSGKRQALSAVGLILIALAIFVVRPNAFFPAPLALIPTMGAMLIVAYGEGTWAGALLSTRPLKGIGDISYSLYLWHWPIITFYRLETGFVLNLGETIGLVLISMLLAFVTFRVVEVPAQRGINAAPSVRAVALGGGALALLAIASIALTTLPEGLRAYPPSVLRVAAVNEYPSTSEHQYQWRIGQCFYNSSSEQTFNKECLKIDPSKRNLIVLGDSQAGQYWRAFQEARPEWNVIQATAAGCRPLDDAVGQPRCTLLVDFVLTELIKSGEIDEVIFGGRWKEHEVESLLRTTNVVRESGASVTVIGPTVEYDGSLPSIAARAMLAGDMNMIRARQVMAREALDERMQAEFAGTGITYVSEHNIECPNGVCRVFDEDGLPLHFDINHLTLSGARLIVREIEAQMRSQASTSLQKSVTKRLN